MQLPIIGYRGQAKPYPSIPRINWDHPLASGLVSYCYDVGSGPIDLVIGQQRVLTNTTNPPFGGRKVSKFGDGLASVGTAGAVPAIYNLKGNKNTESITVAAPFSFAIGVMQTANPAGFHRLFSLCDATTTTRIGIGGSNATATDFWFVFGGGVTQGTATGLMKVNTFQTVMGVALTSAAAACYIDGVLKLSPAATTTGASASGAGPTFWGLRNNGASSQTFGTGMIYYSAVWKGRALTASEARWLHDDPYCFLIYPEDEMFTSLVGATTGPFQWYQMNDIGLPELPIIRPPLDIVGY